MFRKGLFLLLILASISPNSLGLAEGYVPRIGECLEYDVNIKSIIQGAYQTVQVVESGIFQGRPVVKIQSVMNSLGLAKAITQYSEREVILLDVEGLFPWVIQRAVSDKDGSETEDVTFDYERGLAVRKYSKNGVFKEQTEIEVPGYVQDALSFLFFLRRNYPKKQNKVFFYSDGKIKEIEYRTTQVNESLNLECGNFKGYYQVDNEEKKIMILIAETPEHYPLIIQKVGKIGKVEAKLVKIK